jgi:hypothetical protein
VNNITKILLWEPPTKDDKSGVSSSKIKPIFDENRKKLSGKKIKALNINALGVC